VLASTSARGPTPLEALSLDNLGFASCLFLSEPALRLAEKVISDDTLSDGAERGRIRRAARAHARGWPELAWLAAAAAAHDTRERIGEVSVPTLVLTGAEDALIAPERQAELASAIPGAVHRILEGAGHDVTIDSPAEVAATVRAHLGHEALRDP
jgi:pimeloyl-ACP methyl ester carboxylesterase